VTQKL